MPSPKTLISTVGFADPDGNPVQFGSLQFDLQGPQTLIGGGIVDTETIYAGLDANGLVIVSPAQTLYGNDQFLNASSVYNVTLRSSGGRGAGNPWNQKNPTILGPPISQLGQWNIIGGSPIDLSQMVSVAGGSVLIPSPAPAYVVVPFAPSMAFSFTNTLPNVITFETTLTGNVSSSSLALVGSGQIVIFKIIQDASGNRTFAWPGNVKNPMAVDPTPNMRSVQAFINNGNFLDPIAEMTTNV